MYELERYLRVNLLGPGPRLMKKKLPSRGLTKVEKHCSKASLYVMFNKLCNVRKAQRYWQICRVIVPVCYILECFTKKKTCKYFNFPYKISAHLNNTMCYY